MSSWLLIINCGGCIFVLDVEHFILSFIGTMILGSYRKKKMTFVEFYGKIYDWIKLIKLLLFCPLIIIKLHCIIK